MKNTEENKEKVIEYLYGELADAERDDFETSLFADENLALFLEDVENDLIDEYVGGELEFDEKRKFEKNYLTSDSRAARVDMARTLKEKLFTQQKETIAPAAREPGIWASVSVLFGTTSPLMVGTFAALLVLALVAGYWIMIQQGTAPDLAGDNNSNSEQGVPVNAQTPLPEITPVPDETPGEEDQTEANKSQETDQESSNANAKPEQSPETKPLGNQEKEPTPTPEKDQPELNKDPKLVPKQPTVFAFTLSPPLRSSSTPILRIPATAQSVNLTLFDNFGRKYEKFSVDINTASGTKVWSSQVVASKKRPQKSIAISILGESFKSGNYEIAVKGITKEGKVEELSFYNFSVRKK